MAAPVVIAAGIRRPRLARRALIVLALLAALPVLLVMGVLGAISGLQPLGGFGPSAAARTEIPAVYLRLYQQAAQRYGIDPWILAAIGAIETQHGQSTAPGVRAGVNAFGCCAGPMQCSIVGSPSTWDRYGVDGNHDGRTSPYDPSDAIPAAARYLRASGAPADYRAALFAYNRADWYVAEVLAKAAVYRGAPRPGTGLTVDAATVRGLLHDPRIVLTPVQRTDLLAGGIDPRLLATLAAIGERHTVVITALRADHHPGTNHEAGRAMDIGAVDGQRCDGRRTGACAQLVRELAAVEGQMRATELIYCWDSDGPADPRGFARADHCDHVHWGLDG
jgi:hypothetical protein